MQDIVEVVRRAPDGGEAQPGPLPLLLVRHLGRRHLKPPAGALDDGPDGRPLLLERVAVRNVEVDLERGHVHATILPGPCAYAHSGTGQVRGISRSS